MVGWLVRCALCVEAKRWMTGTNSDLLTWAQCINLASRALALFLFLHTSRVRARSSSSIEPLPCAAGFFSCWYLPRRRRSSRGAVGLLFGGSLMLRHVSHALARACCWLLLSPCFSRFHFDIFFVRGMRLTRRRQRLVVGWV